MVLGTLLALLASAVPNRALADGETSTRVTAGATAAATHVYLSVGLGESSIGPMALANLSVEWGHMLFEARASHAEEFQIFDPPRAALTDYSGLVGLVVRGGATRAYAAVGLGLGLTSRRGKILPTGDAVVWFNNYEPSQNDNTLNVPLQAGVSFDGRHHGVGLDFIANLNREVSTFGMALTYSGGWLQ